MKLLVIDNAEPKDRAFNEPLRQAVSQLAAYDDVNYKNTPSSDHISANYRGVILSGTPLTYAGNVIEERCRLMAWVQNVHVPVLGICLGHQSLSVLFGGSVISGTELEEGTRTIDVLKDDPLFNNMSQNFEAKLLHRCSVTVPAEFALLAQSSICVNEVMKHHKKDIYGVQFHPELHSDSLPLIENFVAIASSQQDRTSQSDSLLQHVAQ